MIDSISNSLLVSFALSSVLLVLVLIMRKVFAKTMDYKILAFLWVLLLIRLIMPFTFQSPINVFSVFTSPDENAVSAAPADEYLTADYQGAYEYDYTPGDETANHNYTIQAEENTGNIDAVLSRLGQPVLINAGIVIWLLGTAFVLLSSAFRMLIFARKTVQCRIYSDEAIARIVSCHKTALGIKLNITIKECAFISTPVIMGSANPVILIPSGMFETLDQTSISMIILHEMCHIKSGDLIKNKLWLIAKAIHWYNPLVWIAYKAFLDDMEKSCDQTVLKNLEHSKKTWYLDALLNTAKLVKPAKINAQVLCFAGDKSKLRKRVETMTSKQKPHTAVSIITIIIIAIFTLACFTTACTFGQTETESPSYELFATAYTTPIPTPTPQPVVTATPEVSSDASYIPADILYYDGSSPSTEEEIRQHSQINLKNVDDFSFLEGMDNIISISAASSFEDTISGDIASLATLKSLRYLSLESTDISGDILSLASLQNLETLNLKNCNVKGDIQSLSGLTKLKYISLQWTGVTGDVDSLASLTNLETLYMTDTAVKGDLASFENSVYLSSLALERTRVSGDLASLKSLINLRFLVLDETNVEGDISVLKNFKMLEQVYLGSTPVTGDISVFADLPYIEWVAIEMTNIYGDVAVFAQNTNLRVLYIYATDVSGDISTLNGLNSLQQALYDGSLVTGEVVIPEDRAMG